MINKIEKDYRNKKINNMFRKVNQQQNGYQRETIVCRIRQKNVNK